MKTKTQFGFFAILCAFALVALPQSADAEIVNGGVIRSIDPVQMVGTKWDVVPEDDRSGYPYNDSTGREYQPFTAGQKIHFRMRLINPAYLEDPYNVDGIIAGAYWSFSPVSVFQNYAVAWETSRPALGVIVGGELRYARLIEVYCEPEMQNEKYAFEFTDFIFEYVVEPGDIALPMLLANNLGKPAREGDSYNLLNQSVWKMTAGGQGDVQYELSSDGLTFGDPVNFETTYGLKDGYVKDFDLNTAMLYIQTVEFASKDLSVPAGQTEQIRLTVLGGGSGTNGTVYIRNYDTNAVSLIPVKTGTSIVHEGANATSQVLKVTINKFETNVTFNITGVTSGQRTKLYLSSQPTPYFVEGGNVEIQNAVPQEILCSEPPTPYIKIVWGDDDITTDPEASMTANANWRTESKKGWVILSQTFPADVTVNINAKINGSDVNPVYNDAYISDNYVTNGNYIALGQKAQVSLGAVTQVLVKAGSKSASFYVAALGASQQTQNDGIVFTPSIAEGGNGYDVYKDFESATLFVENANPVDATTRHDFTAEAATGWDATFKLSDAWRDLKTPKGWTFQFQVGSCTFTTNNVTLTGAGEAKFTGLASPGMSAGEYPGTVSVTDPMGDGFVDISVKVTVNPPRTVKAFLCEALIGGEAPSASGDLVTTYCESTKRTVRFELSTPYTSVLYGFLEPKNAASTNYVSCKAFTNCPDPDAAGVPISKEKGYSASPCDITFLDGSSATEMLDYDFVLCTSEKYDPANVLANYYIVESHLYPRVTNAPPSVTKVTLNGSDLQNNNPTRKSVASGAPMTVRVKATDLSSVDLSTNFVARLTYTEGPAGNQNSYDLYLTNNAPASGSVELVGEVTWLTPNVDQKLEVRVKDKDMDDFPDAAQWTVNVHVAEQPYVTVVLPDDAAALGGWNEVDKFNSKTHKVIVRLSEEPRNSGLGTTEQLAIKVHMSQTGSDGRAMLASNTTEAAYSTYMREQETIVYVKATSTEGAFYLRQLNGASDSSWTLWAEVCDERENQYHQAFKDNFQPSAEVEFSVFNVRPAPTSQVVTNLPAVRGVPVDITATFRDVCRDVDPGYPNHLRIEFQDPSGNVAVHKEPGDGRNGTLQIYNHVDGVDAGEFCSNTVRAVYTYTPMTEGDNQIAVSVYDDDESAPYTYVVHVTVPVSKHLNVSPVKPNELVHTKYDGVAGLGVGRIWGEDGVSFGAVDFTYDFSYPVNHTRAAKIHAYGYPAAPAPVLPEDSELERDDDEYIELTGYEDAGQLVDSKGRTGRDNVLSKYGDYPLTAGQDKYRYGFTAGDVNRWRNPAANRYEYEWEYDNFFYCWIDQSKTACLDTETTLINGVPRPSIEPAADEVASVYLDAYEAGKEAYEERTIVAVFSREYLKTDNMGDINADGIPDLFVQQFNLTTGSGADGAATQLDDLTDFSALNADLDENGAAVGDYLPFKAVPESILIPGLPDDFMSEGAPFTAKLELRGFEDDFNDALSYFPKIKAKPDVLFTRTDVTNLESIAYHDLPERLRKMWTPENPTDPLKVDSDGDGYPDGYQYYYWYYSKVGWLETTGTEGQETYVHHYLTGRRFNPLRPGEDGELITSEEIYTLLNPNDPADVRDRDLVDTDNDGLPDWVEFNMGTNPFDWDTDHDGLPDLFECYVGTDPCSGSTTPGTPDAERNFDYDFMACVDRTMAVYGVLNAAGQVDYYAVDKAIATRAYTCADGSRQVPVRTSDEPQPGDDTDKGWRFTVDKVEYITNAKDLDKACATNEVTGQLVLQTNLESVCCWEARTLGAGIVKGLPTQFAMGTVLETPPEEVEWGRQNFILTDVHVEGLAVWDSSNALPCRAYTVWKYGQPVGSGIYGDFVLGAEATISNQMVIVQTQEVHSVHLLHYLAYQEAGFHPDTAWKAGGENTRPYNMYDEFLLMTWFHYNGAPLPQEANGLVRPADEPSYWWLGTWGMCCTNPNGPEDGSTIDTNAVAGAGLATTWDNNGIDTDGDGVPDGWELYMMGAKKDAVTGMYNFPGPGDGNSPMTSSGSQRLFWGQDVKLYYKSLGVEQLTVVTPGGWKWFNKRKPCDLKADNGDTDGDGIPDAAEEGFCNYAIITDDDPAADGGLVPGGGLDPLSWDTDGDGLPDPYETAVYGYGGTPDAALLTDASETTVNVSTNADGTAATNTVTTMKSISAITNGLDGTVADANGDIDHDGLKNWQEYLTCAMRCWRYDDPATTWGTHYFDDSVPPMLQPGTPGWNQYWYLLLNIRSAATNYNYDLAALLGGGTYREKSSNWTTPTFNPHLYSEGFDPGASYFSVCRNSWDTRGCHGKYYILWDGVDHDLSHPPDETAKVLMVAPDTYAQYNRFTWPWYLVNKGMMPAQYGIFYSAMGQGPMAPQRYVGTNPMKVDTDDDGMDDYYELFHGLNPILGSSAGWEVGKTPLDIVYKYGYGGGRSPNMYSMVAVGAPDAYPASAKNNFWTYFRPPTSEFSAQTAGSNMDFTVYPWLNGLADADPDGDNLRNQEEAIMPGLQAASTWHHTDPSPLWMTDPHYANSLVRRYYQVVDNASTERGGPILYGPWIYTFPDVDDHPHLTYEWDGVTYDIGEEPGFTWTWDSKNKIGELSYGRYTLNEKWQMSNYWWPFEVNEGYDSDHDYLSDFEEAQGKTKSASDPQQSESPYRRQAMWFGGRDEPGFLETPTPISEMFETILPQDIQERFLYYSVECWVKPEDPAAYDQTVIERLIWTGEANMGDRQYLRRNFYIGIKGGKWYTKYDYNDTTKRNVELASDIPATTEWTHLAAPYAGGGLVL